MLSAQEEIPVPLPLHNFRCFARIEVPVDFVSFWANRRLQRCFLLLFPVPELSGRPVPPDHVAMTSGKEPERLTGCCFFSSNLGKIFQGVILWLTMVCCKPDFERGFFFQGSGGLAFPPVVVVLSNFVLRFCAVIESSQKRKDPLSPRFGAANPACLCVVAAWLSLLLLLL